MVVILFLASMVDVVLDPYEGLDYDTPNLYEFGEEEEVRESCADCSRCYQENQSLRRQIKQMERFEWDK